MTDGRVRGAHIYRVVHVYMRRAVKTRSLSAVHISNLTCRAMQAARRCRRCPPSQRCIDRASLALPACLTSIRTSPQPQHHHHHQQQPLIHPARLQTHTLAHSFSLSHAHLNRSETRAAFANALAITRPITYLHPSICLCLSVCQSRVAKISTKVAHITCNCRPVLRSKVAHRLYV